MSQAFLSEEEAPFFTADGAVNMVLTDYGDRMR